MCDFCTIYYSRGSQTFPCQRLPPPTHPHTPLASCWGPLFYSLFIHYFIIVTQGAFRYYRKIENPTIMSVYNVRFRKNGYQKYINRNCLKVPLAPPMGLHFKNYCIVVLLFNSEMFFVLFCSSVLLHSTVIHDKDCHKNISF